MFLLLTFSLKTSTLEKDELSTEVELMHVRVKTDILNTYNLIYFA